jgi:hypothetical protein
MCVALDLLFSVMRVLRSSLAFTALLALVPTGAFADATAFVGTTMTPASRLSKGFAAGVSLLIVGFEFEYSTTAEDVTEAAPSLKTGMGNILLQTPIPIGGVQFYATTGVGGYRERLGVRQETNIGMNTGGGAKISLAGPVRVRLDYRAFTLRGDPLHSTVHRLYAGLNLAF